MRTYHLMMSNGVPVDVKADSASEAIWKGLDRYRGQVVTECFSGNVVMNTEPNSKTGQIHYEIPKHQPLPVIPK